MEHAGDGAADQHDEAEEAAQPGGLDDEAALDQGVARTNGLAIVLSVMIVDPMLATSGPLPGDEERWTFEPKWDGFRAICTATAGRA